MTIRTRKNRARRERRRELLAAGFARLDRPFILTRGYVWGHYEWALDRLGLGTNGASISTLIDRVHHGGRKGRAALRRILRVWPLIKVAGAPCLTGGSYPDAIRSSIWGIDLLSARRQRRVPESVSISNLLDKLKSDS